MHRIYISLLAILLAITGMQAAPAVADSSQNLTVSLITCWPGREVYELCGHEAIRVRTQHTDSVWNYGTFDFAQPNFVGRFVKGETDYMLSAYPFAWFMPEYVSHNRRVVEQELNLSQDEARRLLGMLRTEALPANREYRYNYVRDNCATRITERLQQASRQRIIYPDSARHGTFRSAMRHYHKDYPWYQFGIDIALGQGIDRPISRHDEMFAPLDMMESAGAARFADGRPLVRETRVLFEGSDNASLPPTPFWLTPIFWSYAALALTIGICIYDAIRRRITRWWWSVYFLATGLAGCVVTFLVFFSSHEATSPNTLIVWLNPLQLIYALSVWSRRCRPVSIAMSYYNIAATGILLLTWPVSPQCGNPAFFPLMGCAVALGAAYAIIHQAGSYNNKAKAPRRRPAARPRHDRKR